MSRSLQPAAVDLLDSIGNLTTLTCLTRLVLLEAPQLGNLTELRLIPHLQSLDLRNAQESLQRAASFVNLQTLELNNQWETSWDLSCCTGLTKLSLSIPPHFQRLSLPLGRDVQLQVLTAFSGVEMERGNERFVLEHLAFASKLTGLAFITTYPSNLRGGLWPFYMPRLQNVSVQSRILFCQNSGCLTHS